MKQIFLIIATLFSLNIHAVLKEPARQEKSWQSINIEIPSMLQPAATGYLTGAGTWRLEQIAPELQVTTELKSSYASSLGLAQFTKYCGRMSYGFATVRELNHRHIITLGLPDWKKAVDGAMGPQPMRILKLRSRLAFEPSSFTLRYGNIHPRHLEGSIESQVQDQSHKLRTEGQVEIDITGHDYLACDFITGQMRIGLEVQWEYPSAKLKRTPTLRSEDLSRTIERAKAEFKGDKSCHENLILASAIFANNLNSVTDRKIAEIGAPTYLAAFNAVYDHSACQLREDSSLNTKEIAKEFDLLSKELSQSSVVVFSRFNGVIK